MAVALVPPGRGGEQQVLQALYDAVRELQNPGAPTPVASVDLKTDLATAAMDPALWPLCVIGCEEINALVRSTLVAGSYVWLRADGSAI